MSTDYTRSVNPFIELLSLMLRACSKQKKVMQWLQAWEGPTLTVRTRARAFVESTHTQPVLGECICNGPSGQTSYEADCISTTCVLCSVLPLTRHKHATVCHHSLCFIYTVHHEHTHHHILFDETHPFASPST